MSECGMLVRIGGQEEVDKREDTGVNGGTGKVR
jgi:hypothetical protein